MGIDVHGLNFLRYSQKFGEFGSTIMLGRQGLQLTARDLQKYGNFDVAQVQDAFSEKLLLCAFGATRVDSVDFSDYEGANILHDFNMPISDDLKQKYSTVLDFGSWEHVFEVTQALKNCSLLCRPAGQILHVLPANNLCGHGFWQFSPELFFSLYSDANGYENTEVFFADLNDLSTWFKVREPDNGQRVTARTSQAIYILVRTVLKADSGAALNVQQSDYVDAWDRARQDRGGLPGRRRTAGRD